jgi:hypothetical protein
MCSGALRNADARRLSARHRKIQWVWQMEGAPVKLMIATTLAAALGLTPLLAADDEPAKRLNDAAVVFSEIMATLDKGIPQELLEKAHCIVIVPDLKTAAFVWAGNTGKGTCLAVTQPEPVGLRRPRSASRAEAWASRSAVLRRT